MKIGNFDLGRTLGLGTVANTIGWAPTLGIAISNGAFDKNKTENPYAAQLVGGGASAREADMAAGRKRGEEIFRDSEMNALGARYADLAKGYSGQELGALRGSARNQIADQQNAYSRQLASNAARAGVGGARRAAMLQAGNEGFNKNTAAFERGLTADNAALIRSGLDKEADFRMGQKYGGLGTELGYAQLGVSDRTQANQAANNQKDGGGFNIFDPKSWFNF